MGNSKLRTFEHAYPNKLAVSVSNSDNPALLHEDYDRFSSERVLLSLSVLAVD